MSVRILSGGELVYEPWPWAGDWHMFSGSVDDYSIANQSRVDPDQIWREQRNVRLVVGFLARNFAQVRCLGYERKDDGDRDRLDRTHRLSRTLRTPDVDTTEFEFSRTIVGDLALWDRWAAVKIENNVGTAVNDLVMRRLPPRRWRFIRDPMDRPIGIRYFDPTRETDNRVVEIALSKCVWLDGYPVPNPGDQSPMEHLKDLLTEEVESSRARIDMWKNGARISGVIERPLEAPKWEKPQRDAFGRRWREAYTRHSSTSGSRMGGTPVLEDGMVYKQMKQITPEQAEQIEARKLSMAEVAAAFFVAPELVGAREGTFSNVQAYREMLYSDTLGPMFMQVKQAYDARLVPDLADPDDVFVEHNVAEKLRMSFEEQAKILSTSVGGPWMLRNEARQRVNLRNLPKESGADELIVPLNVVAGGQASPQDSRPDLTGG